MAKTNYLQTLFDQVWCRCNAWLSSGGVGLPIARLSPSRGPARCLRKVLWSCQSGCCNLPSASFLRESCQGRGQGWGRTEHLLEPCCPERQCRPVAGPCTYERHYRKDPKDFTTLQHRLKVSVKLLSRKLPIIVQIQYIMSWLSILKYPWKCNVADNTVMALLSQ